MKDINHSAPVKCSKSITIQQEASKVWETLTNIDQWDTWQKDITKPKLNGPLREGSTFRWKTGGANIHSTLHTVAPHNSFGWTGKTMGLLAIHNWHLTETNGATIVGVEESMEGFLSKFFKRMFSKNLEKGMERWLEMLKQKCEG